MKSLRFALLFILSFSFMSAKAYDIVVAQDGTGQFTSIQAAISSVRDFKPEGRTVIFIRKGVYKEKVVLPTQKTAITLIGEDRDSTIITWDDHANINKMGTFKTFTFFIGGNDIVLENLTIENNAPQKGQAVALHVEGDRCVLINCRVLGNQDTVYLGREGSRFYAHNCYIEGTTDFIFGASTAWFEGCTIHCKRNSYITAASTPQYIPYGFIFNNCTITHDASVTSMYLGRPWRAYAMTLFINCQLPAIINPAGWENWRNPANELTARYFEYANTGPGADRSKRVAWSHELTEVEAASIPLHRVFGDWEPIVNLNQQAYMALAKRVAEAEMTRNPKAWMIDFNKTPRWNYTHGVVCSALLDLWEATGDDRYVEYVKAYADTAILADGSVGFNYKRSNYNLDHITPGNILYRLSAKYGTEKYRLAIEFLRQQLREQPRTSEGGFWHKKVYPHQMWLDGLFMATPFLAQYAVFAREPAAMDDAVKQLLLVAEKTYDPVTGLYTHAWDESKSQAWADPKTGKSHHFWGRSVGWYAMALVDALDFIPEDHPQRAAVIKVFNSLAQSVVRWQDAETGTWYQLLNLADRKADGNYLESSCSAMFVYALVKGVNQGYLDQSYMTAVHKGFRGLLHQFLAFNPDGTLSITQTCSVAGLGGNPYRDGSFEYYVSERVRQDDPKATGPFIRACLELSKAN
jgi:unsaturated rhamnogalacturonyl hydrolase